MKTKKIVIGASLLAIIALALGAVWQIQSAKGRPTAAVTRGNIAEAVYGLGTVTSRKVFKLKSGISSQIRKIHVKEGDAVKAQAPLMTTEEGVTFRAAFDSTVTSIPYTVGEAIFPQMVLMTLMDLSDLYVSVSLEQQGALRVRAGQSVQISFESLRGQKVTGKVRTIFPNEEQFMVYIEVEKFPAGILPGMTGDVAIQIAQKENAMLVPVSAVESGRVAVKRHGRWVKIPVQVGTVDGARAEVNSKDLQEGDLVLTKEP
jgi:multidrug efflux pump subunit AcrA (membrane-fusion protein)